MLIVTIVTQKISSRIKRRCFYSDCVSHVESPHSITVVQKGFFYRTSDSKTVRRYYCRRCKRSFSNATSSRSFRQKKRTINEPIRKLLVSGVSQRRISRILRVNRKTVVRKLLFLANLSTQKHEQYLKTHIFSDGTLSQLQFDEMESFERSKCLPVSIPIIVEPKSRKIIRIDVCSMPPKGLLADISRKRYGKRKDDRANCASKLLSAIALHVSKNTTITTDENPKYPKWIKNAFQNCNHIRVKGRRACIVGQGELKRGGFDPLFSLNHTCAMIRANVNRLFRRTWCTTKRIDRLAAHLMIYVDFHNTSLT